MRHLALAFLVSFALGASLAACGPSTTCNNTTCPLGCCDVSGKCQSASNLTCGTAGAMCSTCGVGQTCFSGVCTGAIAGGQGGGSTGGGGGATGGGGAVGGGGAIGGGGASGGGGATGGGATGGGGTATGGGGAPTGGGGGTNIDCTQQVTEVRGSGGCILTVVSPANCQTVDFSSGTIELAWSTLGPSGFTFCEGPQHVFLLGHPSSTWMSGNGMDVSLTSTNGNWVSIGSNGSSYTMTRDNGGAVRLVRADLAPLMSPNGQFHFTVSDFYALNNGGSRAGSVTFIVPP